MSVLASLTLVLAAQIVLLGWILTGVLGAFVLSTLVAGHHRALSARARWTVSLVRRGTRVTKRRGSLFSVRSLRPR